MGRVYRAMDTRLTRRVALKVLHPGKDDALSWADSAARMLREARAAAALEHPNVVAVYDVGEHEGVPHIAGHRDGRRHVRGRGRLGPRPCCFGRSPSSACGITRQDLGDHHK